VGRVTQYSDWLLAGLTGDRIPLGGVIFPTFPDRPWGPPSLLYNGYRLFPAVKSGRGVNLTPHPLLVPWSWKSKAIHLLTLWAVRPVQSLSACTRVNFFSWLKWNINFPQILTYFGFLVPLVSWLPTWFSAVD